MARNIPVVLSDDDAIRVAGHEAFLTRAKESEAVVTLSYVKRSGERGTATGPVLAFTGSMGHDTRSVTLDTVASKGRPTTVNLVGLTSLMS